MAERVVHELEVIEVQEQHGDGPQIPVVQRQRVREPVLEEGTVRQSGEAVVEGLMQQLGFARRQPGGQ